MQQVHVPWRRKVNRHVTLPLSPATLDPKLFSPGLPPGQRLQHPTLQTGMHRVHPDDPASQGSATVRVPSPLPYQRQSPNEDPEHGSVSSEPQANLRMYP